MKRFAAAVIAALLTPAALGAAPFDPRAWQPRVATPTEVMVLGTMHLSGLPDSFDAAWLSPVIDRLAAFKPDIITIEGLSGEECQHVTLYVAVYPDVADGYCKRFKAMTEAGFAATGLTPSAAADQVHKTLLAWPAAPSPAERRHLAALFASAGEPASALVQWLRLPEGERHPGDGLDAKLVEELGIVAKLHNEDYLIAAVLAARLGLDRVCACDDHTSDQTLADVPPAYEQAIKAVWSRPRPALATKADEMEKAVNSPRSLLDLYRFMSRPEVTREFVEADFGAALVEPSPQRFGRQYVGWWETRNLRMIANIRAAATTRPGSRVLSIVGASHKPYFEAYLGMMSDMKLVDIEPYLAR